MKVLLLPSLVAAFAIGIATAEHLPGYTPERPASVTLPRLRPELTRATARRHFDLRRARWSKLGASRCASVSGDRGGIWAASWCVTEHRP